MRDLNWYTGSLFIIGLYALFEGILYFHADSYLEFILFTSFIIILELFPIKLISGDDYSASAIGYICILFKFGLPACAVTIVISTLLSFIKRYRSIRNVKWFRYFVTVGMYFLSASVALETIRLTEFNTFFQVFLASAANELTNSLLIAGIHRSVMGVPLFHNFPIKLRELIVPILVSSIVVSRFLYAQNSSDLIREVLYTTFFILVVLLFSTQYIKQIGIRQDTSKEFIRILENRITGELSGHGTRVGIICDMLIEHLRYPKNKKHDLIQMAIIHDIGKSLLPVHVFRKRGALTLSEEKEYQTHCERGAEIIRSIFPNKKFDEWILYHHEQWDGKGFPKGLKGAEIPLEARILALCNHLDHIMKRHSNDETVYQLLLQLSGNVLDPSLVGQITVETISYIRLCLPVPEELAMEATAIAESESEVK
ncbi:HD-GYP domain-containing protein, partial [Effusibacillus pohliae]|uniref:HD-GYP domain-containing protein n=1 Tax=Effusibacillus pohliae TaxID=232270 RepID=UPI00036FF080